MSNKTLKLTGARISVGCEVTTLEQAIQFIDAYEETRKAREFVRYEVNVRYTNGDEIRGTFESKTEAVKFLSSVP